VSILAGVSAYAILTYGSICPPDGIRSILRVFATYQDNYIGVPVTVSPGGYSGTTSTNVGNPLKWEVPPTTYTVTGTYNGETKSPAVTVLLGQTSDVILSFGTIIPPQSSRHTFTWLACEVTPTILSWCQDENFTDVVIWTYFRKGDFQKDYSLFSGVGIQMWSMINLFDWDDGRDLSLASQISYITGYMNEVPGKHVYLDDVHHFLEVHGTAAVNNLLTAVRSLQTLDAGGRSNLIVEGFWGGGSSPFAGFDFSGIDVDLYTIPSSNYAQMPKPSGAASVGGYLWPWDSGLESLSFSQITQIYSTVKASGFTRMTAWLAYAPDYYSYAPQYANQMKECSFYEHPAYWPIIKQVNTNFLAS
jgi:hypothetical protein